VAFYFREGVRYGGNVGLDKWGPEEGSGWLMGMVESVRGGQEVAGLARKVGCCRVFNNKGQDLA
jgi:hypothetical protein